VIEIGGVEVVGRRLTGRRFHGYVDPERSIDDAAIEVHGITMDALIGKPKFRDVVGEFLDFVRGAELVIHNAAFDVSFLNYELSQLDPPASIEQLCTITDSLAIARDKHPGQKNGLDALCRRYGVDNSQRDLHGALLDADSGRCVLADRRAGRVVRDRAGEAVQRGHRRCFIACRKIGRASGSCSRSGWARVAAAARRTRQTNRWRSVWQRIATPA
jgi:DNA polymerase-3 subunit epsilon